jgi:hypothetical protein
MVAVASRKNGAETRKGNHTGHKPADQPQMPHAPPRKPSGTEPASPRKTRAGLKLKNRKAAEAPASARHK